MRHSGTVTALGAVLFLLLFGTTAFAQVYAGESGPGWIVSYEGTVGTVVNPDTQIPGVQGLTIDEFGNLLVATTCDLGDVLLLDVDEGTLEVLEYHESDYAIVDVYPDPADSNIYVIKNGDPGDGGDRMDSYLGMLRNGSGPAETVYAFGDNETVVDLQVWPIDERAGNVLVLVKDGNPGPGFLAEFEKTGPGTFVRLPDIVGPGAMVPQPEAFAITPEAGIVIVDREEGLFHVSGGTLVPFGEAVGPRYADMEIESDGTIYLVNSRENDIERYDGYGVRIEPDLSDGITDPTAITAASFAPTPEGENSYVEPIEGVQVTFEEVMTAGFTSAVAESTTSRVSPEGNYLPDCAVLPGSRAEEFIYIGLATEAIYRSLIQVDVLMEGSRLFYASGVEDTFRDFTVVGTIEDARGTMPRFSELSYSGGTRVETGPTEVVLVDDTRTLSQVILYKFWRLEEAMQIDILPGVNSCPWQIVTDLHTFRERARYHYDNGDILNALSELAILNSILRDHADWCVPELSNDEDYGNLVGKILAHSKTLMFSLELENGEPFTGLGTAPPEVTLAVTNPAVGECTLSLSGPAGTEAVARIYSVSGRLVATVFEGELRDGGETVLWNGFDNDGNRVASGAYFALVESGGRAQTAKLIYVR